jgi:hypothetical protein
MAKKNPKRSEIRLALELILDREYDIPVVPALKELDGLGARVAELEAKAEGDLNFIKSLNDEADRYREALSNIEDLVTGEGAIGNVVSRLCAKALRPETYE